MAGVQTISAPQFFCVFALTIVSATRAGASVVLQSVYRSTAVLAGFNPPKDTSTASGPFISTSTAIVNMITLTASQATTVGANQGLSITGSGNASTVTAVSGAASQASTGLQCKFDVIGQPETLSFATVFTSTGIGYDASFTYYTNSSLSASVKNLTNASVVYSNTFPSDNQSIIAVTASSTPSFTGLLQPGSYEFILSALSTLSPYGTLPSLLNGSASFNNLTFSVTPEPSCLLLSYLPLCLIRRRARSTN